MPLMIAIGMLLHILWYIENAPVRGLLYEDKGNTKITCYFDTYWGRSQSNRRSTLGTLFLMEETWSDGEARSKTQLVDPI